MRSGKYTLIKSTGVDGARDDICPAQERERIQAIMSGTSFAIGKSQTKPKPKPKSSPSSDIVSVGGVFLWGNKFRSGRVGCNFGGYGQI